MRRTMIQIVRGFALLSALALWPGDAAAGSRVTESVIVLGSGVSRDAAIREALQLAVQQVRGGHLASLTEVSNGLLTAHDIQFHTDGVVEHYELLGEERLGNRVQVRLDVTVQNGVGTSPQGTSVNGDHLLALAETRQQRHTTAGGIWPELLNRWPERVTRVTPVTTEPMQVSVETGEVQLRQTVQINVDRSRYNLMVTELNRLLGTVAVARGRFDALMVPLLPLESFEPFQSSFGNRMPPGMTLEWLRRGTVRTCRGIRPLAGGDNLLMAAGADTQSMLVFVQSTAEAASAVERWQWFQVPLTGGFSIPYVELELTLFDDQGEAITSIKRPLGEFKPGLSFQRQTFGHSVPSLVVGPTWLIHSGTTSSRNSLISMPGTTVNVTLSLPRTSVARMRRVEVQLRTASGWEVTSR